MKVSRYNDRDILFDLLKETNRNKCFICNFDIEKRQDLCIDPERKFAHKTCYAGYKGHKRRKGSRYIGIYRKSDSKRYNGVVVNNYKAFRIGLFETQEEAAIARDIGVILTRNGVGKLNFEMLRNQYNEKVKEIESQDLENPNTRNQILKLVNHFYIIMTDYVAQ